MKGPTLYILIAIAILFFLKKGKQKESKGITHDLGPTNPEIFRDTGTVPFFPNGGFNPNAYQQLPSGGFGGSSSTPPPPSPAPTNGAQVSQASAPLQLYENVTQMGVDIGEPVAAYDNPKKLHEIHNRAYGTEMDYSYML